MSPTLFLEAFGQLVPNLAIIDTEEEDLYSVFNARAELMGWSTLGLPRSRRSLLWGMEEAKLTAGLDASRIGWVQVGLELGASGVVKPGGIDWIRRIQFKARPERRRSAVEPAKALPALTQCFDDALGRFGVVELSGFQVTASGLEPSTRSGAGYPSDDPFCGLNWFNTARKAPVKALVAFDYELLAIPRQNWLPACSRRTPKHSRSGRWPPCLSRTRSRCRSRYGGGTPPPRILAWRSRCRSGQRVLRHGSSPSSSTPRAPSRPRSATAPCA